MTEIVLALGPVLAVEGLVLALAPRRIEDALRLVAALRIDQSGSSLDGIRIQTKSV